MHLDEEQLQRVLHGEVSRPVERAIRDHLAECTECRERLAQAQRQESEIFALLRQVDHPMPAVDAGTVAARARGVGAVWGRRAAGILIFLGAAGAAYAIPGSPLRDWVRSAAAWIGDSEQPPPAPAQVQAPGEGGAGIAAIPGRRFVIAFKSPESGGSARVSLTDRAEVSIRGPLGAASYTSDAERLVIDNQGSGATFEIEIPRAAPRVEIRVAGDRVFLKDGARVVTNGQLDAEGYYLLRLSQH